MDAIVTKLAISLGLPSVIGYFSPIYFGVVNILPMILTLFFYADKSTEYNAIVLGRKSADNLPPEPIYDFIIVGSGSSGSVLANRLSENFKVLLLERGGNSNPLTEVPYLSTSLLGRPETDYSYKTVSQNLTCLACTNRQSIWSAGMGLGGSSILNGMTYIRPSPYEFQRLASYTNDSRWSYDSVLPYLLKSEGFCRQCEGNSGGVNVSLNTQFHNVNGELPVGPLPYAPLVPEFLDALEWGDVSKGDLNAPYFKPTGDLSTAVHKNGRNVNAYQAFIEPIFEERISLTVMKYARVMQILFEPGTNTASGVKFERFGKFEVAKARREVILCAGAIETAKLLLLSGIGPKHELEELRISVRVDVPVGRNLQNHVGTIVGPFLIDRPFSILADRDINDKAVDLFLKNGTGPLTSAFSRASTLWTSTRAYQAGEESWPDIHVHFSSNGVDQNLGKEYSRIYNMNEDIIRDFLDPLKGSDAFSFVVYPGRPKSRGVVRLKSANYLDDPMINPGTFEDPDNEDIETIVEAIQRIVYLAENAPSFKRLGAQLSPIPFPSCSEFSFRSPEYWECYARHFTIPAMHPCCTASSGPRNSYYSVVDSEMRVLGTEKLRVVDASVLPFITTVNTYASILCIAERAADLILGTGSRVKFHER